MAKLEVDHGPLADLLDDLTHQQLSELLVWMWLGSFEISRAAIKGWRKDRKLPVGD